MSRQSDFQRPATSGRRGTSTITRYVAIGIVVIFHGVCLIGCNARDNAVPSRIVGVAGGEMGRPLENFGIEGVDDLPIEATVVYSRKRSKGSVSSGRLLIFNDVSPKEAGEVISCFTDDAGLMQSADLRANTIEQINRELPASEAKVEEVKLSDSGNFVLANSDNKHICGFVYEHGGRLVLWIKVPGDSQPDMSGFGEIRSRR